MAPPPILPLLSLPLELRFKIYQCAMEAKSAVDCCSCVPIGLDPPNARLKQSSTNCKHSRSLPFIEKDNPRLNLQLVCKEKSADVKQLPPPILTGVFCHAICMRRWMREAVQDERTILGIIEVMNAEQMFEGQQRTETSDWRVEYMTRAFINTLKSYYAEVECMSALDVQLHTAEARFRVRMTPEVEKH